MQRSFISSHSKSAGDIRANKTASPRAHSMVIAQVRVFSSLPYFLFFFFFGSLRQQKTLSSFSFFSFNMIVKVLIYHCNFPPSFFASLVSY